MGWLKPKSVIRTSICINHLLYIAFSSIFALLFAVLLPVWSCHSSLCLRQNGCNTHEHKGKTDWKSNDRFGFNGCQRPDSVATAFDSAMILMDESPESALEVLRDIVPNDLRTKEQHARYALLYSQALDKNFIDVDSDSLIRLAVDYYKDKDDVWSKFHAYYYLGRIHVNAGEPIKILSYHSVLAT